MAIHLIIRINPASDDESRILKVLEELGLLDAGIERHRIIFCETDVGKEHIVRHIHPEIHIDYSGTTSRQLLPHLPRIYLVGPSRMDADCMPLSGDPCRPDSRHAVADPAHASTLPGLNRVHRLSDIIP